MLQQPSQSLDAGTRCRHNRGTATSDPRFIVPAKVDDLAYSDHNIQIQRLNALNFTKGWGDGLAALLKTLEENALPRPKQSGPSDIASWWNAHKLNRQILRSSPQTLWTNWFPLKGLPKHLWAWESRENSSLPSDFVFPTYRIGDHLFSFADARVLTRNPVIKTLKGKGQRLLINLRRGPARRTGVTKLEMITAIKQLVKQGWERAVEQRGLPLYELSSRRRTLWFPTGTVQGDTVTFIDVDGEQNRRDLYGYRTMTRVTGEKYVRRWHFGLEAVPILYPSPVLALKPHVVFTLDGKNVTGDANAQHRARRSQCRLWWNDKWRDLILAAVTWLAQPGTGVSLSVCPKNNLVMERRPLRYNSEVSYCDSEIRSPSLQIAGDNEMADEKDETEDVETIEA
jgi:hypothetical protein